MSTTEPLVPLALHARAITKRFPLVIANDALDLQVRPGEIHGLLGENGSGKSTLCKVLTGLYQPDEGDILIDGAPVTIRSPADAYRLGVVMVHQNFSLIERMTVEENLLLGMSAQASAGLDRAKLRQEASDRFHIDVNPAAFIWQLSMGERQQVEILKALFRGARTLILDEPTTVLTPTEAQELFAFLRRMRQGGGSVIFISHKLHEVLELCDRVTVLRDGRSIGTVDLASHAEHTLDARALAKMMVGREITLARRSQRPAVPGAEVLVVDDLVVAGDLGHTAVRGVSLSVRAGEILGVAGVAGNGQRELVEAICGLRRPVSGQVIFEGTPLSGSSLEAIERGIAYVPEDRAGVGLVPRLTISENLVLKDVGSPDYCVGPFLHRRRLAAHASEMVRSFKIKGSPDSAVRLLSGGNAQKVVLARELSSRPRLVVVAAPTRGLDVGAMEAVRELLLEAAAGGVAVLMVSEDLDEIFDLADRVAVMCAGQVTGIVDALEASVDEVGVLMMGSATASPA